MALPPAVCVRDRGGVWRHCAQSCRCGAYRWCRWPVCRPGRRWCCTKNHTPWSESCRLLWYGAARVVEWVGVAVMPHTGPLVACACQPQLTVWCGTVWCRILWCRVLWCHVPCAMCRVPRGVDCDAPPVAIQHTPLLVMYRLHDVPGGAVAAAQPKPVRGALAAAQQQRQREGGRRHPVLPVLPLRQGGSRPCGHHTQPRAPLFGGATPTWCAATGVRVLVTVVRVR